jgi:hypothetical protein
MVFAQATEARSSILTGLAAALYVAACLAVWERPESRARWALAAATLVAGTWLFLYLLLMGPVVLLRGRPGRWWRPGVAPYAVAALLVSPVVVAGIRQRGQIAWIPDLGPRWVAEQIATQQYFLGLWWWVAAGWLAAAVGLWRLARTRRGAAVLVVGWVVVPTALLLAGDMVAPQVLYQDRYLAFTAPAVALLLGAAATWPPRRAALVTVTVAAAAASSLPLAQDRFEVSSKSSWRYAERVLADQAQPGDGLITFAPLMTVAENVYPHPMADLRLLNADPDSRWMTAAIYPRMGGPLPRTLRIPDDVDRVWYLSERTSRDWRTSDPVGDLDLLESHGFHVVSSTPPTGYDDLVVTLLER